ncbi:D-alanyl-D-alanine carboxypeptidase [Falsarthrobacter nasiphocae]|uniref:D-alanyl-D-alanine carboxypeptidase/D-alanyl-D-alanine-endopeptidase (Penicillin-binding protein 4) n=1 Tax=Falsarthrobacter nasiphocae TaxID=189863 RepID=A0AAE3YDR9_9MICC|nr:D-alanyl-D-alanine carboxypeptidase [Falsarthrobacter nasiphocae]MDR6891993.1 D-alanyl-D-alanine carboxypeptidase/D-alanyl-D-alanine-endopeptidase (penicillin-binding protein 4) [Falsarthrobacter nasiphocae]
MRTRTPFVAALSAVIGASLGVSSALLAPPPVPDAASSSLQGTTTSPPPPSAAGSAAPSSSQPGAGDAGLSRARESAKAALAEAPSVAGQAMRGSVVDLETGEQLAEAGAAKPFPPASSVKLVSAAAILDGLGAERTLKTRVSRGATATTLVLSGEGDALLGVGAGRPGEVNGRAGIATLAAAAAKALVSGGADMPASLTLAVDDSLFPEPLNPAWPDGDLATGQMTRLSPFAVNGAFAEEGADAGLRVADPAMTVGRALAEALSREVAAASGRSVSVTAVRGAAGKAGAELAAVTSAPVGDQVEFAMARSDNYVMEALARAAAREKGLPATSAGVARLMRERLAALTPHPGEIVPVDASGLSADNVVTARSMAGLLRALATSPDPAAREEMRGLPVAGLTGTLAERFVATKAIPGQGLVRAKTGTLNGTSVLAGFAVTPDHRRVVFIFAYDGIEGGLTEARQALDIAAARLVS